MKYPSRRRKKRRRRRRITKKVMKRDEEKKGGGNTSRMKSLTLGWTVPSEPPSVLLAKACCA